VRTRVPLPGDEDRALGLVLELRDCLHRPGTSLEAAPSVEALRAVALDLAGGGYGSIRHRPTASGESLCSSSVAASSRRRRKSTYLPRGSSVRWTGLRRGAEWAQEPAWRRSGVWPLDAGAPADGRFSSRARTLPADRAGRPLKLLGQHDRERHAGPRYWGVGGGQSPFADLERARTGRRVPPPPRRAQGHAGWPEVSFAVGLSDLVAAARDSSSERTATRPRWTRTSSRTGYGRGRGCFRCLRVSYKYKWAGEWKSSILGSGTALRERRKR